ncbi:MAG: hypothetical protein EP301_11825 [Gammaproteobacteria bacterium]|nr:MAG: hypothetical protein EP301_11825 [Gammaproteobacteria bacterium]
MIRERTLWTALESLLLIACAGYWFGNTGVALAVLWLAGPGRPRAAERLPTNLSPLRPFWVSERRLLLRAEDGRRIEVYRDEVSPREWASLKRRCLTGQPATGRSTSI